MIKVTSEAKLLECFRRIDQAQVQFPKEFRYPLPIKSFTSWLEPSGHRVYLVFEDTESGNPIGIVFQRTHGSADASPAMCQWCNTVRGGSAVSLLTAAASENRRVGLYLCSDLKCGQNDDGTPGTNDLRESLSHGERLLRLMGRMSDFARRNLF